MAKINNSQSEKDKGKSKYRRELSDAYGVTSISFSRALYRLFGERFKGRQLFFPKDIQDIIAELGEP